MEPHTSQDVENERLKLQNDIQKIQDTLYEDSYSEYDSSDDSCLEIDLGSSERNPSALTVTDDDARTHSSFAESSASHFDGTEISEVTDFEQEINVGDAESAELPVSVESCLALNRAYQEVIVDVLRQTEASLEENRQKQQHFEKDVVCQREKNLNSAQSKVLYKHFSMPYIKDPAGGGPPPNEDVQMKQLMKEHKQDIPPDRDWLNRDRKKLYEAIAEDALQQLLQPLMMRQELEQDKLERCSGKDAAAIRARIRAIEEDMVQKRKTSRSDLLKNVDTTKTDWMKISNIAYDGRKTWQECQTMWNNVLSPNVNRGKWEPEEEKQLLALVRVSRGKHWEKVAADLQTGRTAFQCLQHYQMNLNPENSNRPWKNEEDLKLLGVVSDIRHSGHRLLWSKVSSYMENRSGTHCFSRFQQIDPDMKRGPWSTEEDVKLFAAVKMCGTQSWMRLAEFVPGRSSIQCRDRWLNSLDPSIRLGNWSYEEDKKLLKAITELGTKSWTKIAAKLNGRTDNMVLQRYRRLEIWQRKCKWFDELPETTKRALLGGHLSSEELKEREHTTWRNFQEGMGVLKEDYAKQERDRQKGDIVVPRPPPLLGYGTSARQRLIEQRVHLQNIILKHVRFIQNSDVADTQDGDEVDTQTAEKLAAQIHYSHNSNMSVKKLIELSRNVKGGLLQARGKARLHSKRNFNFRAVERNRRLERSMRGAVHSIYKTKKKMKKGRPRKFFNRTLTGSSTELELRQIKVKSLNIVMKALDVDPRTMLENASKFKNMSKSAALPSTTPNGTPATPTPTPATPTGTPAAGRRSKGSKRQLSKAEAKQQAKKAPPAPGAPEPMGELDMLRSAESERSQEGDTEGDTEDTGTPGRGTAGLGDQDAAPRKKKSVTFVQGTTVKTVKPASRQRFTRIVTKTVSKPDLDPTSPDPVKSTASISIGTNTESSAESDSDEPLVCERSLPYLPPNVTNLTAFKSLLLNRRKNITNAGSLYDVKYYHMPNTRPKHQRVPTPSESNDTTESDTTVKSDPSPTLTTSHLRKIRNTEQYALLKARFQALFVWPALVSTIHPPFDRKDFCQKAKTITAGEEEVENLPRAKTKGYPLSRGSRFYRKQVMSRAHKQGSNKKSRGSQNQSDDQVDAHSTPVQSSFDQSLPSGSGEADLHITSDNIITPRGRGRPRGKMKRKVVEAPTRSLRERKEKSPPEKKVKKEKSENRIQRVSAKRAFLGRNLRQSMLDSMAAMEAGLRPDPAQDIAPSGTTPSGTTPSGTTPSGTTPGSDGLTTNSEKSSTNVSKNYSVALASDLECLPLAASKSTVPSEDEDVKASVLGPVVTSVKFGEVTASGVDIPSQLNTVQMSKSGGIRNQGIPMILTYIKGENGAMIPVLNPVPIGVVPAVGSGPVSIAQIKTHPVLSPAAPPSPGGAGHSEPSTSTSTSTS
ncbi:uncharacterized protein LOC124144641 isoform X2 [Haliotis rufescens]|uniref:uncharacterized protein LOC124144641 isoform X2 n=1 Tax=Haliotis rufescens TaxID=6454 RepID=UPI00201ECA7D|nr:uncharacterized protein LOC124144641 isoform X2 [Haliotis rufescens]